MLHNPFEDIEGGAQAGEELQEEAGAGGALQRRRVCCSPLRKATKLLVVGEAGDAAWNKLQEEAGAGGAVQRRREARGLLPAEDFSREAQIGVAQTLRGH